MFSGTYNENSQIKSEDSLIKIKKIFFFLVFLIPAICYSQNYNIDYYGVVSTEIDSNMSKMTSDLYYTQLSEISNFSISDKRSGSGLTEAPEETTFSETALSFYTEIKKEINSDKWITKIFVIDKAKDEIHTKEKKYDSYYKILMESKNELKETIRQLIENDKNVAKVSKSQTNVSYEKPHSSSISSTESLAGTWGGEENIEKIVILRGGRGFVIFKSGASMNISVELNSNNQVLISQKGKGNASFYPELPRNVALTAALDASPIQWVLTFNDDNSLSGVKNTLLPDGDSYASGSVNVNWIKLN